jgi:hypothetical protein
VSVTSNPVQESCEGARLIRRFSYFMDFLRVANSGLLQSIVDAARVATAPGQRYFCRAVSHAVEQDKLKLTMYCLLLAHFIESLTHKTCFFSCF